MPARDGRQETGCQREVAAEGHEPARHAKRDQVHNSWEVDHFTLD